MRVVMVTRQIDRQAVEWGFTHDWVRALAPHVDHLDVISHEVGDYDLPANVSVHSLGRERGVGRTDILRNLWRYLDQCLPGADVLFLHSFLQYGVAGLPMLIKHRPPYVLWYAFGLIDWELLVNHIIASRIVTSTRPSYPIKRSNKVTVIGHGVDFDEFSPPASRPAERVVISVGRMDISKGVEELVEVASRICAMPGFEDVSFRWIGGVPLQAPEGYGERIAGMIREKGLEERFTLAGGIPFAEVHTAYQTSHVMVSLSRTGSLDKVMLEASGCGLPVLATGPVFRELIGEDAPLMMAGEDNLDEVTEKLAALLRMSQQERDALGLRMRERAVAQHSIETLMRNLAAVFEEVRRKA